MSLKPWREIATPHKDVLAGTFKQSEFAADITQVASGTALAEYQDAYAYNELIQSWHAIVTASHEVGHRGEQQGLNL
ncbi:hypothetical protein MIT9_P0154 [Methylomarinovum caldicuralii]|uniref:Uncharacterized protein n=1 Tax=Methylomarinovum caldicuralii TaxID=438856 RepID=A0AAU9C0D8_9GAMM|nr:hypothetical protein [Methylomarinovum caldicuralii]BCX80580.1 hypothetical protein MIT9_P0154 [Methylomarinovum caldicuralii]